MGTRRYRLLLIEDDVEDADLVRIGLRRSGHMEFEIEHVRRLKDAESAMSAAPPDVILLDLSLPDSVGLDTIRSARTFASSVPIVVLTGADEEKLGAAAIREGVQDYLSKSLLAGELLARSLRYAMERFSIEQELIQYRDRLEGLVRERTAALEETNELLQEQIAERERAYAEKERLQMQLRQQQKLEAIGTLASGIAHEVNNPINGIMNYAQLLVELMPNDVEKQTYAREIIHEAERVSAIVRNLLAFARHQDKVAPSPAHMHEVVGATLSLIRTVMRHDRIELDVSVPARLPPILCRSQEIQQVVMNLVTNARDALNERYPGPADDKRIVVSACELIEPPQSWVRLTVEDSGNGIRADILDRVFDPFFTTKSRELGTGLGLSISHGIVTEHNGRLYVETEPDAFTRFHVDFPIAALPDSG